MSNILSKEAANKLLGALGEQLDNAGERYELVVIGGSGLLALGVIDRATRDVDVVALRGGGRLESADPLPPTLRDAARLVARDFELSPDWLNGGPTTLLDLGLPAGFSDRLESCDYGEALRVDFASHYDQIHLKLYATVDAGGPGKHLEDLLALAPTEAELLAAARWSRTHDPSPAYEQSLRSALDHLGVQDADLRS